MLPFLILLLSGIVTAIGDLLFKLWTEKDMGYSLIYFFGIFMYVIGSLVLVESYKYDVNIAIAGVVQIVINTLILVAFTFFYFKEPITAKQSLGLLLAVFSLYLIR